MKQQRLPNKSLALIGAGPIGFGFILKMAESLKNGQVTDIKSIDIFDSYGKYGLGAGLPYDPETTDLEHLLNVESKLVNIDGVGKFKEWLETNESAIREKFKYICSQRFEEKFEKRFGVQFDPDAPPLNEEQRSLKEHYDKIWNSIESRYLNFKIGAKYHPRVLFGIRSILFFEEAIAEIRSKGVEVREHPQTEITSLAKASASVAQENANLRIQLGYKNLSNHFEGSQDFSDAVMSTGRWRLQDQPKPKHVSEVWPIEDCKANLLKIIEEEIAVRKARGDSNDEIKVAIQGQSLTAFDAVKTILDGSQKEFEGYNIKVDMLSRSGVMQQVKGIEGWEKEKFGGKFPEGTEINQKIIEELAANQNGQIGLWQVMLMTARALENAYRIEEQESKANQARDFVKLIIGNLARENEAIVSDASLDAIKGSAIEQLRQMQNQFGLALSGAKYEPIISEFNAQFLNQSPIEQLHSNLAGAELGDIPSKHLLWKSIFGQIDSLTLAPFLAPDESAFRFQILDRTISAFNNGMPIDTAQYLLSEHEQGRLDCWAIGEESRSGYDQNGRVFIQSERGETRIYDAVISARGYDLDFTKNPSSLGQSMRSLGGFTLNEAPWANNTEEFAAKREDLSARFGEENCEKMLKKFYQKADGKFYYSTGDYRRVALDESGAVIKSPVRELVDLENNRVLPGLLIPFSGGLGGAISNGAKVFAEKFSLERPGKIVEARASEALAKEVKKAENLLTNK